MHALAKAVSSSDDRPPQRIGLLPLLGVVVELGRVDTQHQRAVRDIDDREVPVREHALHFDFARARVRPHRVELEPRPDRGPADLDAVDAYGRRDLPRPTHQTPLFRTPLTVRHASSAVVDGAEVGKVSVPVLKKISNPSIFDGRGVEE